MKYFARCTSPDELRSLYRQLALQYHPDRGGNGRIMQEINDEYHDLLKSMNGREFKRTTDAAGRETWTYYYNQQKEEELAEAVERILSITGGRNDIDITVVGLWIWITGNTRPIKNDLKSAGCWWNHKRSAWNWHSAEIRSHYNRNVTLDDILASGTRIKQDEKTAIGA